MLRMIETFSGIGSQTQALKNIGLDHEVVAISEWDVNAMYAYDILHNGKQDLTPYRHYALDGWKDSDERAGSSCLISFSS